MTNAEEAFTAAGQSLKGPAQSQMFGKPCFKISGRHFVVFLKIIWSLSSPERATRKPSVLKALNSLIHPGGAGP